MTLPINEIIDNMQSHALTLGLFENVNGHEPQSPPTAGLSAAIWADRIEPYAQGSGLNSTSALVVMNFRIYHPVLSEPQDRIDPSVIAALDGLFAAWHGDFTFGTTVRNLDLLGESGTSLSAEAGYVDMSENTYRIMHIVVPLIVNDVWTQSP